MITPQAPITTPTNPHDLQTLQVQAEDTFGRHNIQQRIKEIYLRHLVLGTIQQSETQNIATGVTIMDLKANRTIVGHNEDAEHFAASINKVPVALLVLEDLRSGKLTLDQTVTWQESDRRAGYGQYDQEASPLQGTVRDVLYDMLNASGNTAVRVAVNKMLGGNAAVNARWQAKPQLANTYLIPLDADRFFLGNTTPRNALWAMQQLLTTQDVYGKFFKNALATNIFTDYGVRSQLGSDYIVLSNKVGILDDVEGNNRHDVGIIYNTKKGTAYGYAFMHTAPYNETDPAATEQADAALKDMGRYLLRFAGDRKPYQATSPALRQQIMQSDSRFMY